MIVIEYRPITCRFQQIYEFILRVAWLVYPHSTTWLYSCAMEHLSALPEVLQLFSIFFFFILEHVMLTILDINVFCLGYLSIKSNQFSGVSISMLIVYLGRQFHAFT